MVCQLDSESETTEAIGRAASQAIDEPEPVTRATGLGLLASQAIDEPEPVTRATGLGLLASCRAESGLH